VHRKALSSRATAASLRQRETLGTGVLRWFRPRRPERAAPLARCDPLHDVGPPGQTVQRRFWMTEEELAGAAAAVVARIARQLRAGVVPEGTDPAQLLAPAAALRVARQVELAARVARSACTSAGPARMACPGMISAGCWASARLRLMQTCPSPATRSTTPSDRGRQARGSTRRCSVDLPGVRADDPRPQAGPYARGRR
jgi:hypothetical protein